MEDFQEDSEAEIESVTCTNIHLMEVFAALEKTREVLEISQKILENSEATLKLK